MRVLAQPMEISEDIEGRGMKLVDVQIVAAFLGVSRQTIGRMIEGGALTAVPIRTGKRKKVLRIPH